MIVKRLDVIEDLGPLTVLCTDKTGTLTGGTVEFAQALAPDGSADARILDLEALNAALQKGYRNPLDDAILRVHQPAPATSLGEVPHDFVGLLTFREDVKDDVNLEIADLSALGVRVIMVSGDNRFVSQSVASRIGLRSELVVTGTEIDRMSPARLRRAVTECDVFAEVEPPAQGGDRPGAQGWPADGRIPRRRHQRQLGTPRDRCGDLR